MGPDAIIFIYWMLSLKPTFSLFSFTFIKRLFSSSSLSAIRVVSSAYLLLIFLPAILIPACASSSPAFLISRVTIYSLDVLLFLFGTSLLFHVQVQLLLPDLHIGFSRGRSDGPVFLSFSEFSRVYCDPHSQRLCIVHKAEIDIFLELSCFFDYPADVGNLISGSSTFSKASFNIWKFMVHVLLKPGLENFEHYFNSVWDKCNCVVVWAFFGITFLWDWNENWPFPVLWPLLSFPNLLAYWVQHFLSIIF